MIRNAKLTDARDIARIHVDTWRDAYTGIIPGTYLKNLSKEGREVKWAESITRSTDGILVIIDEDERLIGWISFGSSRDEDAEDTGEVYAIYLESDHWSKGFGRQLMTEAEKRLGEKGFSEVTLWVLDMNTRARRFYEKAGYVTDGARKTITFDNKTLIELRYRKTLNP